MNIITSAKSFKNHARYLKIHAQYPARILPNLVTTIANYSLVGSRGTRIFLS